ncbi:hypothetical protein AAC387_Pa02g1213 [Persea americana]
MTGNVIFFLLRSISAIEGWQRCYLLLLLRRHRAALIVAFFDLLRRASESSETFIGQRLQIRSSVVVFFIDTAMAWQPYPLGLHMHTTCALLCSDDDRNLLQEAATSPSFSEHSAATSESSPIAKPRSFFSVPSLETSGLVC